MKPWLYKQSKEYIGQEEAEFVNIILKRLANRDSPQQVLKKVEKLLDEDAEVKLFCEVPLRITLNRIL